MQVAFLTGRSDPWSCALSPVQRAFLAALDGPDLQRHPVNFPYTIGDAAWRAIPLPLASLRNTFEYLASRRTTFATTHRAAMTRLLDAAPHTVLLAGSCGLEMLANLGLPATLCRRTSVFAFGPVARRLPACRCYLVQGRDDRLSRRFHPRVDRIVDGGHLDYLRSPVVLQACNAYIAHVAREERIATAADPSA